MNDTRNTRLAFGLVKLAFLSGNIQDTRSTDIQKAIDFKNKAMKTGLVGMDALAGVGVGGLAGALHAVVKDRPMLKDILLGALAGGGAGAGIGMLRAPDKTSMDDINFVGPLRGIVGSGLGAAAGGVGGAVYNEVDQDQFKHLSEEEKKKRKAKNVWLGLTGGALLGGTTGVATGLSSQRGNPRFADVAQKDRKMTRDLEVAAGLLKQLEDTRALINSGKATPQDAERIMNELRTLFPEG